MKELKYKGKAVKIVNAKNKTTTFCNQCIFENLCSVYNTLPSELWEEENNLDLCLKTNKKYIYK